MELLKSAANALQRHFSTVLIFVGVSGALGLCWSVLDIARMAPDAAADADPTLAARLVTIGAFVVYSAVIAAAQTFAFSRMGREIDRPLWKVRDDREAFQRFYSMWFEFNLATNTAAWIAGTRLGGEATAVINLTAIVAFLGLAIVIVPFGACLMFFGRFSWGTFGEALGPIVRRPAEFTPVFGVTLVQLVFAQYVGYLTQTDSREFGALALLAGSRLACDVAIAYLDCLVFAAAWIACKDDRDSPDEIDLDF